MQQELDYETVLKTSHRVNWTIDDVMDAKGMDFGKAFLPESFAKVRPLTFLSPEEQRTLNQIRAHGYLAMFSVEWICGAAASGCRPKSLNAGF